ncbi:chemotaxis protein CheB [Janthinobacterium sp. BJB1]|uniref:chemotaxis protein CheB n=1 Tax=Janthinobacterium sp. GW458P TaxID=1981504 RepID=UPI000A31F4F0|nr:chemotaxis protein CheB [Janthinobacterium sp. GW458P]MBE3024233.1 chemotaxis protein CheB [Janthinobacterium sp. GW458P]PHV14301.1 chemotaxis protein CheB [Janthinobacterium sp. BJB303]PJC96202.1 chemotaxis protein CheB [Janthinobacterium sp. BJB1]
METLIVMGASAGGVNALSTTFAALPAGFPAAILVVMHVGRRKSVLPEILGKHSALPVRFAETGEPLRAGCILLAPPDRHMLVVRLAGRATVELTRGPREHHTRPAIDPLFRSAAAAFGPKTVGVILSGYLDDGTAGLRAIKAHGGRVLVQEPQEAQAPSMPQSALAHVAVDWRLSVAGMAPVLLALAAGAPVPDVPQKIVVAPSRAVLA